jgi:hypothetical protein
MYIERTTNALCYIIICFSHTTRVWLKHYTLGGGRQSLSSNYINVIIFVLISTQTEVYRSAVVQIFANVQLDIILNLLSCQQKTVLRVSDRVSVCNILLVLK